MAEEQAAAPASPASRAGGDWRALVWWGLGLALLSLVALFCRFLLAPWLQVRAAVPFPMHLAEESWSLQEGIKRLGGPDRAVPKLVLYVRLPERLAPRKEAALRMLGQCGEQAVPALIGFLRARDPRTRAGATAMLGVTGDPRAKEPLIATLQDPDWTVRWEAAMALGRMGDSRAAEPLIAWLKNSDTNVRYNALLALSQLADARAMKPLISALKDADPLMRAAAAGALGNIRDVRAVESLLVALKDKDEGVRGQAARALGLIGASQAVDSLRPLLQDRSENVRNAAAEALKEIRGEEPPK